MAAEFPDADEETLADTLEGLTDLVEMIGAVTRSYLDDRAMTKGLRSRIDEMQMRLRRLEHSADSKREVLATVMERAEISRLKEPDFTLSLRRSAPSLQVHDETLIPSDFFTPQPSKLDRRGLLEHLKAGQEFPGATLCAGAPSITVRTK